MSDHVPTVGELRQAYVEAAGATVAQESYYAEQVAEFERGIARIKADAWDEGCEAFEAAHRWDNAEPWQHLTANPYREESGL